MHMDNSNAKIMLYLARLIQPMYGNNSSVKCVVNEHGDSAFVKDANLLLSLLDIEHPVAQLIVSVVSSHSHRYGSGVKSLMVMMGQLSEVYLSLLDRGLPRDVIISLIPQIIGILIDKVKDLRLKIAETPYDCEPFKAPSRLCTTDSSHIRDASTCQKESTQGSLLGSPSSSHDGNHQCQCSTSAQPEEVPGVFECDILPAAATEGSQQEKSRNFVKLETQDSDLSSLSRPGSLVKCAGQDSYLSTVKSENLVEWVALDSDLCSPIKFVNLVECDTQGSPVKDINRTGKYDGFLNYENFSCRGQIKSDNCSSLNHHGNMSETRVVHLHMKVSEGGDEDDVDDVDWYFDREVPKLGDKDPDISCASVRSPKTVCSDGQDLVSSLKDADQHDEDFDDCFNVEGNRRDVILDGQRQIPDVKPLDTSFNDVEEHFEVNSFDSLRLGGRGCRHGDLLKEEGKVLLGHENNLMMRRLETYVDDDFSSCFDDYEKDVQTSDTQNEDTKTKQVSKAEAGSCKMDLKSLNSMLMKVQNKNKNGRHKELDWQINVNFSSRHLNGLNDDMTTLDPCSDKTITGLDTSKKRLGEMESSKVSPCEKSIRLKVKNETANSTKKCTKTRSESFEKLLLNKLADKSKQTVQSSLTHSRHFKSFDHSQGNLAVTNSSNSGLDSDSRGGLSLGQATEECTQSGRNSLCFEQTASSKKMSLMHQAAQCTSQGEHSLPSKQKSVESTEQTPNPNLLRSKTLGEQAVACRTSSHSSDRVAEPTESSKQGQIYDCVEMNLVQINESFKHSNLRCEKIQEPTVSTKHGPNSERTSRQELSLHQVGAGLSRGCTESMELVLQTALTQMRRRRERQFDSNLVSTCIMSYLPSSMTGLVDGLVVECETDIVADLRRKTHRNTLLLNGDLSSSSHHQGYKNSTKGKHVIGSQAISEATSQDRWIQETLEAMQQIIQPPLSGITHACLKDCLAAFPQLFCTSSLALELNGATRNHIVFELSVTLVLVKGIADPKVKVALSSKGILVIERVSYRALCALRETTGVELAVYAGDCSQSNVCERLTVQPCDQRWMDKMAANKGQTTHVVINTVTESALQTVLLCHPSSYQAELQEQEVMSCSKRLEAALHDGTVLPGGGRTEQFCSEYLIKNCEGMKTSEKNQPYVPVVAGALAEVFNNIVNMIGVDRPLFDSFQKTHEQKVESKSVHDDILSGPGSKSIRNLMSSKRVSEEMDRNSDVLLETDETYVRSEHLTMNSGAEFDNFVNFDDIEEVYDNFQSKMAAWNAAMDTVSMVTQTDAHIVTGVTTNDLKNGVFINGVIL